jgi:hypothetical protein
MNLLAGEQARTTSARATARRSCWSTAFLLEHQDRLGEATAAWRFVIGWYEERGYAMSADWRRRELHRLEATLAGS